MLIVNYNYARFIREAIDSVLRQTFQDFEIIVVDDGSTDDSRQVVDSYVSEHPERIRSVYKDNGGVASALNAAFEASRGEVIAILDADDRFSPDKLEHVVEQFSSSTSVGLVVNRLLKFGASEEITGLIPQVGTLDEGWLRNKLLRSGGHWSFAPASGLSLSRDCAEGIFPIPEDEFRTEADSYIFTQAPLFWEVRALTTPLSYYRLHSSNVTSSESVDAAYAEKIMNGIERMSAALTRTAKANRLQVPKLIDNPTYAEMTLIRDYLRGHGKRAVLADLWRFWIAAYKCQTADRIRWRLKPILLSMIVPLPPALGQQLLQMLYLPTRARRRIASLMLRQVGSSQARGRRE